MNYERLMQYVNEHPELHTKMRWGTLTDYFKAAHERLHPADITDLRFEYLLPYNLVTIPP